jgi:probable F420-dependent oxidoreductase
MTLQFSFELPTHRTENSDEFVTAEAILELTSVAAAAGFAAVGVSDHPAPDGEWLDGGGHHALDPFVALSFAATADPRIRLLTNIYVAAYRNPFLGAKSVQSLDRLSAGRLILGVGAGYLEPEFAALGIDFDSRGELLDDALEVLDAVLTGADVAREGRDYRARGVRLRPLGPSGARPPVWVGGNSRTAMQRAARHEGWAPFFTAGRASAVRTAPIDSVDDLAAAVRRVRALRADPDAPFDVCWSEPAATDTSRSVDERCSHLTALAAAGVTWIAARLPGRDRAELVSGAEAFGREIIEEGMGS